jgi:F-type H+-transporting ATPase subunit b
MDLEMVIPNIPVVVMQLAATLLLVLFIKKKTYKMYQEYMQKRTSYVNDAITTASENKEQSEVLIKVLDDERNEIKVNKQALYNDAVREGNLEKDQIITDAKVRAREILEKASNDVESQKTQVENEISADVFDYVSQVAAIYIGENMTKEDELKLINQAVDKVANAS